MKKLTFTFCMVMALTITAIAQPCPQPIDLGATNITETSADLIWSSFSGLSDIEFGINGFTPGTGTLITGVTSPYSVTIVPTMSYDFYVRDDCGGGEYSLWSGPYTFTTAQPLTLFTTTTNVSCYGGSDGSLEVNIEGGTAPYAVSVVSPILWPNPWPFPWPLPWPFPWPNPWPDPYPYPYPDPLLPMLLVSLPAGNYTVIASDGNGNSDTTTTTITQPQALKILPTIINNVSCYGGSDGSLEVNIEGGTAPYAISITSLYPWPNPWPDPWPNPYPDPPLPMLLVSLPAGQYSFGVTDANGCAEIDSITIIEPPEFIVFAGTDTTIYEGESYSILDATASNFSALHWTTSGDGTYSDSTVLNPIYSPGSSDIVNGFVKLILNVEPIFPCTSNVMDSMNLYVQKLPLVFAGNDATIYEDETYHIIDAIVETFINIKAAEYTTDEYRNQLIQKVPIIEEIWDTMNISHDESHLSEIIYLDSYSNANNDTINISAFDEEGNSYQLEMLVEIDSSELKRWPTANEWVCLSISIAGSVAGVGIIAGVVNLAAICANESSTSASTIVNLNGKYNESEEFDFEEEVYEENNTDHMNATLNIYTVSNDKIIFAEGLIQEEEDISINFTLFDSLTVFWDSVSDPQSYNYIPQPIDTMIDIYQTYNAPFEIFSARKALLGELIRHLTDSLFWTTSGDGTFTDSTVLNPTYLPGPTDIANGIVELCLTLETIFPCTSSFTICMNLIIQPKLKVGLTAFLEGPYNGSTMTEGLTGLIPLNQPYNVAPWNYNGTESVTSVPPNTIDWILIELRDAASTGEATSATTIGRQAAFLRNDGQVMDLSGNPELDFGQLTIANNLYGFFYHRNHLCVTHNLEGMIQEPDWPFEFTHNFSTDSTHAYGGSLAQKQIGPGVWGMFGGDANADGIVNGDDKTEVWNFETGEAGYFGSDVNLDGQANNQDKMTFGMLT